MANLLDNAVMIALSFKRFGNSKKLRTDSNGENGIQVREVDPRVVRASKTLIESPEVQNIGKFDTGVIRNYVVSQSVPSFAIEGLHFCSKAIVKDIDAKLEELVAERSKLIDAAVATLPERILETAKLLGPAFDQSDYPTVEAFRDSYEVSWRFLDLSVPDSLKDTAPEIYEEEKAKAESSVMNAVEQIKILLRGEFGDHVARFIDRLEGKRENGKVKIFRDSMVENLNQFLGSFNARNLTGDDGLADLVALVRDTMDGLTADDLRTVDELRDNVLAACKEAQERLQQLVATTAPATPEYAEAA